jgi:hypothetical protein
MRKTCAIAIVAILLAGLVAPVQRVAAQSATLLEDLEFRLEGERHERLVKRRTAPDAQLAPFKSDGCSGGLSAGWAFVAATLPAVAKLHGNRPPWEHCCVTHDRAYHVGGASGADAKASFFARRAADEELRACVVDTGEKRLDALSAEYGLRREEVSRLYQTVAEVMYRAVRLGGVPCSGLSWRWGFGWPQCD